MNESLAAIFGAELTRDLARSAQPDAPVRADTPPKARRRLLRRRIFVTTIN
jgi:hypothetical protein